MQWSLSRGRGLAVTLLLAQALPILSHSWVEEVHLVAANGSYVGEPGYVRDFIPRSSPQFSDIAAEHKVPPDGRPTGSKILATDMMCREGQTLGKQSSGFPALVAAPKDNVALRFNENGHVTLFTTQKGKPNGRGTIFIYGTSQSLASDTYLNIHRVWNTDGTGGDKRGKLLSTSHFDDGRCFQVNSSPLSKSRAAALGMAAESEVPCQSDVQIPADAPTSGLYTLYWVWEWPTLDNSGNIITNESYTSCMDISMTSKSIVNTNSKIAVLSANAANANSLGIQDQLSEQFQVDPTAPPQPASDNPLTPGAVASPTKKPAVGASGTSSPQSITTSPAPAATRPPGAASGMVTITVTEQEHYTVTVTRDAPSTKPTTLIPQGASTTSGASPKKTSAPSVAPFLAPDGSVVPGSRTIKIRGR